MQARAVQQGGGGPLAILLALESSGPGGAEQMVLRLAGALQAAGELPTIATLRPGWLTERAERAGIPVWIAPQRHGYDPLWIPRFARRLRRERIALVHSHEFTMNVYAGAAALLAGVPSVATLHGHHYAARRPRRVAAYRALRLAGMPLVAVSHELAAYLASGLGLDPQGVRVIPNGVPLPPARPEPLLAERAEPRGAGGAAPLSAGRAEPRPGGELRRELGVPEDGALILAIGNLYPVKDHASLLRALALLPARVHVAIAGRGEQEQPLRALAAELGIAARVHLLGLRDDVDALLHAADVFAQPSRAEGLPLALLEAMAAGVPVVASRVGGMAEAVRDGESGLLVEPADPQGLAGALRSLLEWPERAAQLAVQGRTLVEREYSVGRMCARYRALYAERLGEPGGARAICAAP